MITKAFVKIYNLSSCQLIIIIKNRSLNARREKKLKASSSCYKDPWDWNQGCRKLAYSLMKKLY